MHQNPIVAVMIHVAEQQAGFEWYQSAFPRAKFAILGATASGFAGPVLLPMRNKP